MEYKTETMLKTSLKGWAVTSCFYSITVTIFEKTLLITPQVTEVCFRFALAANICSNPLGKAIAVGPVYTLHLSGPVI